jgi:hypothetical protein
VSYRIVRFYQSEDIPRRTIKHGLTLEEAQAHCSDPETSWSTCTDQTRTREFGPWFDGYEESK